MNAEVVTEKHGGENLAFGDLERLNKRLRNDTGKAAAEEERSLRRRLDEWFEEIDELGMLIATSSTVL